MKEFIEISEKHSLIIRWCHWLNVLFLSLMIWSGILIYWADEFVFKLPQWFVETFRINNRLAEGMGWHFLIMWPFLLNGIVYVSYLLISGKWRGKYHGAQRAAYYGVILLGAGSILTGLAIYKPVQMGWLTELLGGYRAARWEHFLIMSGFVLFIFVHVVQVIRAGWNTFKGMVAGYEVEKS